MASRSGTGGGAGPGEVAPKKVKTQKGKPVRTRARGAAPAGRTEVWQARIGHDLARDLLEDAALLGLEGRTELVREGLLLLHRRAAEERMARSVEWASSICNEANDAYSGTSTPRGDGGAARTSNSGSPPVARSEPALKTDGGVDEETGDSWARAVAATSAKPRQNRHTRPPFRTRNDMINLSGPPCGP